MPHITNHLAKLETFLNEAGLPTAKKLDLISLFEEYGRDQYVDGFNLGASKQDFQVVAIAGTAEQLLRA